MNVLAALVLVLVIVLVLVQVAAHLREDVESALRLPDALAGCEQGAEREAVGAQVQLLLLLLLLRRRQQRRGVSIGVAAAPAAANGERYTSRR